MKAKINKIVGIFMSHGPAGLLYALRLYWMDRKLRRVQSWMDNERANHAEQLQLLNSELTDLLKQQQRIRHSAARYWTAIAQESSAK